MDYFSEEEQLEQLKQLLRQYGLALLAGLLLALLLTGGWHYWQKYQDTQRVRASVTFESMIAALEKNNTALLREKAEELVTGSKNTPYAMSARLIQARQAVSAGDLTSAASAFEAVLHKSHDRGLRDIARLRLARLRLAEGKPDAALLLLDGMEDLAFRGLQNSLRGEALLMAKKPAAAREALLLALPDLPDNNMIKILTQIKYNQLAAATG